MGFVTEARVEVFACGGWTRLRHSRLGACHGSDACMPLIPLMSIPEAVVEGRAARRYELEAEVFPDAPKASPVRVVDSSGTVIDQWGRA